MNVIQGKRIEVKSRTVEGNIKISNLEKTWKIGFNDSIPKNAYKAILSEVSVKNYSSSYLLITGLLFAFLIIAKKEAKVRKNMVEIFKIGLVIACLFIVVDFSWKIISENKIRIAQLEKSRYVCLAE